MMNYLVSDTKCCPVGTKLDGANCSAVILDNCIKFDSSDHCTECKSTHHLIEIDGEKNICC